MKSMLRGPGLQVTALMMALIFAVAASGCGAMLQGTSQTVNINSYPDQAKATVTPDQGETTKVFTPATVNLKRNRQYTVQVEKEGYQAQKLILKKKLYSDGVAMDVIWCILLAPWLFWVPLVVDWATGGWYEFEPATVSFILEPEVAPPPAPEEPSAPTEEQEKAPDPRPSGSM